MKRELTIEEVTYRLHTPFVTAHGPRDRQTALRVTLRDGGRTGRGESPGVSYRGETPSSMAQQIDAVRTPIEAGMDRQELLSVLPPGGARAALDAALFDLEAQSGPPAWAIAGSAREPEAVLTAYTITLDTPDAMRSAAERSSEKPLLKVKIGGGDGLDLERVKAVREGAPGAELIADGNEACAFSQVVELAATMADLGYALLEQPLRAGEDERLRGLDLALPLCADESLFVAGDLPALEGIYAFGNIKLDKTGGLTAALLLADAIDKAGMKIFTGCMISSALALAPSFIIAQRAAFADLDGPLWLADDPDPITLEGRGRLAPPPGEVWGSQREVS
jgi:L-alanine-DL-glutamate epimerase-like enolase superfamily enzyme